MRSKKEGSRRGQIVVLAAFVVIFLASMAALTVDVGHMYVARARLQNAADAASLAATHALLSARGSGAEEYGARSIATAEADLIGHFNEAEAGINVEFGYLDDTEAFVPVDAAMEATAVRATAFRGEGASGGSLPLFFAPVLGVDSADVSAVATCEVNSRIAGVRETLSPFAVPLGSIAPPGEQMVFYPSDGGNYDGLEDQTVAPGCWGLLNLNGGSLGTTEVIDWITNGYSGTIKKNAVDDHVWINGISGFRATIEDAMIAKIGKPMLLIAYDQVVGAGANADFRCVSFVRVTINEVVLKGTNNPHITGTVDEVTALHDLIVGGGISSPNICKVQIVN